MADRPAALSRPHRYALVAAAEVITSSSLKRPIPNQGRMLDWQERAWDYYDRVGEFRFGVSWASNALSRVNLTAARPPQQVGDEPTGLAYDDDELTAAERRALELVGMIAGGASGQGQLLAEFGEHLAVAGFGWLVAEPGGDPTDTEYASWCVYAQDGLRVSSHGGAQKIEIRTGDGRDGWRALHPNALVVKTWRKHPRRPWEPDAPVRGVLSVLEVIDLLSDHLTATGRSRLAGAGLLAIPAEAEFPDPPPVEGENPATITEQDRFDNFVAELTKAMTTPIRDRNNASAVVPLPLAIPGEYIDKLQHLTFSTPFDDRLETLMEQNIKRLALGLDMPPEVLTGMAGVNHWCMTDDHTVLTRRGWVGPDDIRIGDEAYTLDNETGLARWELVSDLYVAEADEDMLVMSGRYHDSVTTLDHSWPVVDQQGRRSIIKGHDIIESVASEGGRGQSKYSLQRGADFDLPNEAKFSDDLVELVGWMFTEGGLRYRDGKDEPHQVAIYQSHEANADHCARIRRCLTNLYGPDYGDRAAGRPTAEMEMVPWWREIRDGSRTRFVLSKGAWSPIVEHCPRRVLTQEFVEALTGTQLELLLATAVRGDGHHSEGSTPVVGQKDPSMLDALEIAAVRAGYATNRYESTHQGFNVHVLHNLSWTRRRMFRPGRDNVRVERVQSRIWCPTVAPTHTVLARRNGGAPFWTGQTAWQVEETAITLHVEPPAEIVCNALTEGFLRPALEAEGFDPDAAMVWYDAQDLTTPPDKSKSAVAAYDRLQLSADALRRETGFTKADAPDDDEFRLRVLLDAAKGAPTLAPQMLAEAGLLEPAVAEAAEAAQTPVEGDLTGATDDPGQPDTNGAPDRAGRPGEADVDPALLMACDGIIDRAMERAGNRLRSAIGRRVDGGPQAVDNTVDARMLHVRYDATVYGDLDQLLAGSFSRVPDVAEFLDMDADALTETLTAYVRGIIAAQHPHTLGRLSAALFG